MGGDVSQADWLSKKKLSAEDPKTRDSAGCGFIEFITVSSTPRHFEQYFGIGPTRKIVDFRDMILLGSIADPEFPVHPGAPTHSCVPTITITHYW